MDWIESKQLIDLLNIFSENPIYQAIILIVSSLIIARLFNNVISKLILNLTTKTKTSLDNQIVHISRPTISNSIVLVALGLGSKLTFSEHIGMLASLSFYTFALFVWALFLTRLSRIILTHFSRSKNKMPLVTNQTLPLFQNLSILIITGFSVYIVFILWNIDMTAWLASAGIVGIAVGFAAKDTLANLFSGVLILADAPYKISDYIVLDSGERGMVTHIGIRSTRMLTRDDVELTIPNSIMGTSKIINESGGPYKKFRIRVSIGVAYGSDIDQVKQVLIDVALAEEKVCTDPAARVRFRKFGTSSLDLDLLCWVEDPSLRGQVVDKLLTSIYKAFNAQSIEIPYAKQDIYIKELPEAARPRSQQAENK
ncbi:Potassium efflux system KefA protein / Small-conductance mechanosensitive channel [hydrothermal vent metagenome]|uniref:Potassium efflux system KefA protein / Small-conductance mechanosensitive channel n=1 Tax=hydrothermal vent metagenome TaxID=652676 RepID=A0A3B0X1J2_9ZZZZ